MGSRIKNIVGSQVRLLRRENKLSQKDLAARCTLLGFRIEWDTVSKIERQIRGVTDLEMVLLADALRVSIKKLVPESRPAWQKNTRFPHVQNDED